MEIPVTTACVPSHHGGESRWRLAVTLPWYGILLGINTYSCLTSADTAAKRAAERFEWKYLPTENRR